MNELKVYEHDEFGKIRITVENDEVWFIAKDICNALGYGNVSAAIQKHVDDDDKKSIMKRDPSSNYQTLVLAINESGLYSLVLQCKKESAKRFRRWVTSEVLPSINKNGYYMTKKKIEDVVENPDDFLEDLCKKFIEYRKKNKEQELVIERNRPYVEFARRVCESEETISVGDMAKILNNNGFNTGPNRLFTWLRNEGLVLLKNCSPSQTAINRGFLKAVETIGSNGVPTITTRVTGKGQQYLLKRFKTAAQPILCEDDDCYE